MKKLILSVIACIVLAGCTAPEKDNKTITIGASVTPHAEILEHIRPAIEKKGYKLNIQQFTDYVKPNVALVEGSLDANFMQHKPYMEDWAQKANASDKITSVFAVHFEPLGLYSKKHRSLKEVANGHKIAIPNDATNGGRALKLLEVNGIIKLKDGVGIDAKKNDIVEYIKTVEIIEMQAETCATSIQDVDFAVVNGNNALNAKISEDVLVKEDKNSEAASMYANIIAVQTAHKNDAKLQVLLDTLNTEDVKTFINEKYKGIVIPLVPTK